VGNHQCSDNWLPVSPIITDERHPHAAAAVATEQRADGRRAGDRDF
jgi:hypothetical protein